MTCSRDLAEQLTAEVYDALYQAAPRWPGGDELVLTWLLRRARSLALERMRADRREYRAQHGGEPGPFRFEMPDYRDVLRLRSLERIVGGAWSALAPDARRVVETVCIGGATCREAAEALGRPLDEVRATLRRALGEVARHASPRGVDPLANACPQAEVTCALAVGGLAPDEDAAARSHVASCATCAREADALREVVAALVAWPVDLLLPSDAVRTAVFERVGAPAPSRPPARPVVWRPVGPEITYSLLAADLDTSYVAMFVRLVPGGTYPPHAHAAVEELYLLSGELWIDERKVHPGGYNRGEPGARDHRVWSETGCTCVLITSTNDRVGGAMTRASHLTDCGLTGIRWVPYGLHACHFYEGGDALGDALVAYFLAGLYLGEKCLWITAPPLPAIDARRMLEANWPGCADALAAGALDIVEFEEWYRRGGGADPARLVDALLAEEERAIRDGYRALRICANTAGLLASEHAAFHEHERRMNERFRERLILALCCYDRGAVTDGRAAEIHETHHCTFEQVDGWWQIRWPAARASTGRDRTE